MKVWDGQKFHDTLVAAVGLGSYRNSMLSYSNVPHQLDNIVGILQSWGYGMGKHSMSLWWQLFDPILSILSVFLNYFTRTQWVINKVYILGWAKSLYHFGGSGGFRGCMLSLPLVIVDRDKLWFYSELWECLGWDGPKVHDSGILKKFYVQSELCPLNDIVNWDLVNVHRVINKRGSTQVTRDIGGCATE